jgi:hypothetical protein
MSTNETLLIRVGKESTATLLAAELADYASAEVRRYNGCWEVGLAGAKTDRLVAFALEAVQRSLDGDPCATAEVLLDGREYRMHGASNGEG